MTLAGSSAGHLPSQQSLETPMCQIALGAVVSAAASLLFWCAIHLACAEEMHPDVYAGSQKATYNKQESHDAIAVMMCIPLSGVSASRVSSPPCPSPEHSASASETPHYITLIAHTV